jgi:hypothetical protein
MSDSDLQKLVKQLAAPYENGEPSVRKCPGWDHVIVSWARLKRLFDVVGVSPILEHTSGFDMLKEVIENTPGQFGEPWYLHEFHGVLYVVYNGGQESFAVHCDQHIAERIVSCVNSHWAMNHR